MSRTWLFNFGVISDIQYADCDDGSNYFKTRVRYYRHSYVQLLRAAESWQKEDSSGGSGVGVAFVLQLGDLLDGRNKRLHAGATEQALQKLLDVFDQLPRGIVTHHCMGNHELYNMSHAEATRRLWPTLAGSGSVSPRRLLGADDCRDDVAYYSFSPHPGFRFVKVDHFDVAAMGHAPDSAAHAKAMEYLSVNENDVKLDDIGLEGLDKRFVAFNGAMGERQLRWLDDTLCAADRDGEKVVIFGHQPILAGHADPRCLLWNYESVCDLVGRHHCVVLHISGHEHSYWRARDARGVHHLSLPAVIETEPSSRAHATCRVCSDGMQLDGCGDLPSGWYDFLPHNSGAVQSYDKVASQSSPLCRRQPDVDASTTSVGQQQWQQHQQWWQQLGPACESSAAADGIRACAMCAAGSACLRNRPALEEALKAAA